jgi:hypothetical protein
MSATTDPTTLAITGALPGVLLGGALLALPASLLLLWLYRHRQRACSRWSAAPPPRSAA